MYSVLAGCTEYSAEPSTFRQQPQAKLIGSLFEMRCLVLIASRTLSDIGDIAALVTTSLQTGADFTIARN